MTQELKVKVIVQAACTLLVDGKYHGEGSAVDLDISDAARKERDGVVKRAVFIGTDPADMQVATDAGSTDQNQSVGSLQLAAILDQALPQTSGTGPDSAGIAANQSAENAADATANGTGATDVTNASADVAGSAPAGNDQSSAGDQVNAETAATEGAVAAKTKATKAKA